MIRWYFKVLKRLEISIKYTPKVIPEQNSPVSFDFEKGA